MKEFITLAIDTSCDETSASVVKGLKLLSNVMPSQMEFHKKYGGVVPSLAKLAHQERIDNVVKESMSRAGVTFKDLDTIAVTYGPGLAIALEVGLNKAKALAKEYSKPLLGINHMEGHLLSSFLQSKVLDAGAPKKTLSIGNTSGIKDSNTLKDYNYQLLEDTKFPALGVLVSGGHTELILVTNFGKYQKIGETLDDSCGEAYDKCGRILGFGYPAGQIISKLAKEHRKSIKIKSYKRNQSLLIQLQNINTLKTYELPISMANSGDLNFSYSGLKTAFKVLVESIINKKLQHSDEVEGIASLLSKEDVLDLTSLIEAAALAQLLLKVEKAIKQYSPKEIWLGGGVIASAQLRNLVRKVCKDYFIKLRYPYTNKLTGDNAGMIGVVANIRLWNSHKDNSSYITKHNPSQKLFTKDFHEIDRDPNLTF